MGSDTRRSFVGRIAALTTFLSAVPKLFAQQTAPGTPAAGASQNIPTGDAPRRGSSHTHNGIYYVSGTGANDGYPKDEDRKSTRLNSSHPSISYAVFCLKKKNKTLPMSHLTPLPSSFVCSSIIFLHTLITL